MEEEEEDYKNKRAHMTQRDSLYSILLCTILIFFSSGGCGCYGSGGCGYDRFGVSVIFFFKFHAFTKVQFILSNAAM